MKSRLTILLTIISSFAFGQNDQFIDLQWKVNIGDTINYATVMHDIESTAVEMDFGDFFNSLSDSIGHNTAYNYFEDINKAIQNLDYTSILTSDQQGIIDVKMKSRPKEEIKESAGDSTMSQPQSIINMMQSMNQGIVLRGSIYKTGGIHSFWVKNNQRNLIALFFELPTQPVKKGDKWSLDINLIANGENFECEESHKINEVTLIDILEKDGEQIAILKYNIEEYVRGTINSAMLYGSQGGKQESRIKFSFQGIARFGINKGQWISYDGIMNLESSGVIKTNKKTKYSLIKE